MTLPLIFEALHFAALHFGALHFGALHFGSLHPFEQALTLLLAFGPFVVLGVVVWWRRGDDDSGAG